MPPPSPFPKSKSRPRQGLLLAGVRIETTSSLVLLCLELCELRRPFRQPSGAAGAVTYLSCAARGSSNTPLLAKATKREPLDTLCSPSRASSRRAFTSRLISSLRFPIWQGSKCETWITIVLLSVGSSSNTSWAQRRGRALHGRYLRCLERAYLCAPLGVATAGFSEGDPYRMIANAKPR
jgi:hypothetical protein